MELIIFSAFKEQKKYLIFIILFLLMFFLLAVFIANYDYYDYQINYVSGNKEENRGLEVIAFNKDYDKDFESIVSIDKYMPLYDNVKVTYNSKIYQVNYINSNENIKLGRYIENDNEMLISAFCYKLLELEESDIGKKEIEFLYNNESYKYKIVGVLNNNNSQFYVSLNVLEESFLTFTNRFYVLVDQYLNVENVKKILSEKGYSVDLYDAKGLSEIEKVKSIQTTFLYVLVVVSFIIFIFIGGIIKNVLVSESKNVAVLKAVGFRSNKIREVIYLRLIVIIFLSYLLALIASIGIVLFVSVFFDIGFVSVFYVIKRMSFILVIILLLMCLNTFTLKDKINKLEVLKVLQEE